MINEDRGIARTEISDTEFQYWHYSKNNGEIYCVDGWAIADQGNGMTVNEMADYKQISGLVDLPTVDRIVTSIKPVNAYFPKVTMISLTPTWNS